MGCVACCSGFQRLKTWATFEALLPQSALWTSSQSCLGSFVVFCPRLLLFQGLFSRFTLPNVETQAWTVVSVSAAPPYMTVSSYSFNSSTLTEKLRHFPAVFRSDLRWMFITSSSRYTSKNVEDISGDSGWKKGRTEAELDGDLFTSTRSAPPGWEHYIYCTRRLETKKMFGEPLTSTITGWRLTPNSDHILKASLLNQLSLN